MQTLDIDFVRGQFPAFSEPSLEGFAHFENAGGSYAAGTVIERLRRYYRETKVQPYHAFAPSKKAGEQMDRARLRMAEWLNVAGEEVHFGPSTSQNTYVLGQALRQYLEPGDEVIVTNLDHEANVGAWRRLEADGIVIREWQIEPHSAELRTADLEALLNGRTRVAAFSHCSNIVGSVNPVPRWIETVHEAGAIAIVDGVSYAGHGLPDVTALGADIYLFSLYKVYGPHLGVMVMRQAVNEALPNQGHFFNASLATARFTPAGPDHAQIAAVNGVIDYFEDVYTHHFGAGDAAAAAKAAALAELFQRAEREKLEPLLDMLASHPRVRLIGKDHTRDRAPTVSFTADGLEPAAVAARLARENIGIGCGHCYAYRLIQALGIAPEHGVLRTSFVHYTSAAEVNRLIDALLPILSQ
ncbi:MAG: aminotransferase class V-fold PLP-dependent enzyme [Lysobacterales bacterium]|jgi:cysteine desulfurase family protein (TIGR01976 family)